jgi:hypothetical protein
VLKASIAASSFAASSFPDVEHNTQPISDIIISSDIMYRVMHDAGFRACNGITFHTTASIFPKIDAG